MGHNYVDENINKSGIKYEIWGKGWWDSAFRRLLPINCSQISTEIPSSLVIMSYSGWDSREGGRADKDGRS